VKGSDRTDDAQLTRYLLGGLSAEEREQLQQDYLADPELFERLEAAEHDLVDAYVRGALSDADRAQFEIRLRRTPAQQDRVKVARMLRDMGTTAAHPCRPLPPRSRWRMPAAAGIAIIAATAIAWWITRARPPQPLVARTSTVARQSSTSLQRPVDAAPPSVVSYVLRPGVVRAPGAETRISVPAGGILELRLALLERPSTAYSRYQAVLQTATGSVIMRADDLALQNGADGEFVSLRIPASLLERRDYVVLLSGNRGSATEFLRGYSFHVDRAAD